MERQRWLGFVCATLVASATGCGDDDAMPRADAGALDASTGDAGVDAGQDAGAPDAGPPCSPAQPGDPPAGRWALSLFHFNIQYVAGGLEGNFDGPAAANFMYDEVETEDLIIRESFLPILDILEAHASFRLTVEMQGYMIDILRERFPEDLARMRTLIAAGQLEVLAFHYSAQNFLAYPREHLDRSVAMTVEAATRAALPLGDGIFTQEGFFGMGVADKLERDGLSFAVVGHNLPNYHFADYPRAAYYQLGETALVLGNRSADISSGAEMRWSFFNDGELMATGVSPYLGDYFRARPELVQGFVDKLACLEREGFRHGRIEEYLDAMRTAEVTPHVFPFLFDGDWQPDDTQNLFRWMGGTVGRIDRDNEVLTKNVRAGHLLQAAESLVESAGKSAVPNARERLDAAWKELFFGQVSDATGWSPFRGEVAYGIRHAEQAATLASDIITDQLAALGWDAAEVDTAEGTAIERSGTPPASTLTPVATPPLAITTDGTTRPVTTTWSRRHDGVYVLDVAIGRPADPAREPARDPVRVTFPNTSGSIRTTPAFRDEVTDVQFSEVRFDTNWLPAENGLFGVDGGFVVKDERYVHLAVAWNRESGRITVQDNTIPPAEEARWRFLFTTGSAEAALALASATNRRPTVWVCRANPSCGL